MFCFIFLVKKVGVEKDCERSEVMMIMGMNGRTWEHGVEKKSKKEL